MLIEQLNTILACGSVTYSSAGAAASHGDEFHPGIWVLVLLLVPASLLLIKVFK